MPGDDFIDNVRADDDDKARRKAEEAALEGVSRPSAPRRGTNTDPRRAYALEGLRQETERVRQATKGQRNTELNRACFNVGQLVQPDGLTFMEARDELTAAALSVGLKRSELKSWDLPDRGLRDGQAKPRDLDEKARAAAQYSSSNVVAFPSKEPVVALSFADIEYGFWTERESLKNVYLSALSAMCSPWAVLAHCAARALATVRPCVTLPPIIGGSGSLNWFAAIAAPSGGGKGAASAVARKLVTDEVIQRNSGSGEGMINAYRRPKEGDEPAGLRESVMFIVDEIDSLTAQSARSGSTTMSVLRSAFSGETLGFSYINKNTPYLEAHTYRMTMVISVQPTRAASLMDDARGGTPQRIMWFPGIDDRVTADMAGGWIYPLATPRAGEWQYPREIAIPESARNLIVAERVKTMQGNTDALDGHALFVREKFAFALAVLDGRAYVTEQDWRLSGVAMKVSDVTREWVQAKMNEAVEEDASERGRLQGISSQVASEERDYRTDQKRADITKRIIKYFKEAGARGLSRRDVQRKLSRDYRLFDSIVTGLIEQGVLSFSTAENRWYYSA
jgi:hypothetical protein